MATRILPSPFYRYKAPWFQWGGARFTEAPGSSTGPGWSGGSMLSPAGSADPTHGLGGFSMATLTNLQFSASALFEWTDTFTTEARDSAWIVNVSGLTPGTQFGWRGTVSWIVDTVPEVGYLEVSTIGTTTKTYRIPPGSSPLFDGNVFPSYDPYLPVIVPPSGIVTVRVYAWAHPSFFKTIQFGQLAWGSLAVGPRQYRLLCTRPPTDAREYAVAKEDDSVRIEFPVMVDALVRETNHLVLTARWIPGVGTASGGAPGGTFWGWDQAGGWARFVRDAKRGAEFDFGPDQNDPSTYWECKLIDGGDEEADAQIPFLRQTRMTIERTDGQPFPGY